MKPPPIQWARSPGGDRIGYQVVGEGPIDLIWCSANQLNLDLLWDHPLFERFARRLASFSRFMLFNARGSGVSDPVARGFNTMEEFMSDARSVLDAAGSEQACLFSEDSGVFSAGLFAASYPDRSRALVLVNPLASWRRHEDYPWGLPDSALEPYIEGYVAVHGTGEGLRWFAPDLYEDERFREYYARLERSSQAQASVRSLMGNGVRTFDIRSMVSTIRAPTLVISHTSHPYVRIGHGRYIAERIPNARYVERERFCGLVWIHDVDWVLDETRAFLTGVRGAPDFDDRVLATVLFTDIVGSTERAAELGDRRWRQLLDEHDVVARREIEGFRGRAVKSTGDGVMATFDGPARAIRCAVAIKEAVGTLGIEIRTGLHTGEVEQRGEDVGGIAVHIAARVMSEAGPSEVFVSGAVPPLVAGSGLEFDDRGSHELKGVPGEWRLYAVRS